MPDLDHLQDAARLEILGSLAEHLNRRGLFSVASLVETLAAEELARQAKLAAVSLTSALDQPGKDFGSGRTNMPDHYQLFGIPDTFTPVEAGAIPIVIVDDSQHGNQATAILDAIAQVLDTVRLPIPQSKLDIRVFSSAGFAEMFMKKNAAEVSNAVYIVKHDPSGHETNGLRFLADMRDSGILADISSACIFNRFLPRGTVPSLEVLTPVGAPGDEQHMAKYLWNDGAVFMQHDSAPMDWKPLARFAIACILAGHIEQRHVIAGIEKSALAGSVPMSASQPDGRRDLTLDQRAP